MTKFIFANIVSNNYHSIILDRVSQETQKFSDGNHHKHMAAFIPMKVNAERFKSFKALFFGGHPFWHIQRKYGKRTKENMSSDHNCYNFLQEGPINSIPSLDCCHFIADSGNAHNDHFLTIWLFSHFVKTWSYGINKDISGNSYKNAAFWWRNQVDSTFLQ